MQSHMLCTPNLTLLIHAMPNYQVSDEFCFGFGVDGSKGGGQHQTLHF
jgi:hypothetical protein